MEFVYSSLPSSSTFLLDKANMAVLPGCSAPQCIPLKNKKGGYKQLIQCFIPLADTVQKQWTEFLCHELFLKKSNVEIVKEWDFSFPFVFHIKEPEMYENIMIAKQFHWMK